MIKAYHFKRDTTPQINVEFVVKAKMDRLIPIDMVVHNLSRKLDICGKIDIKEHPIQNWAPCKDFSNLCTITVPAELLVPGGVSKTLILDMVGIVLEQYDEIYGYMVVEQEVLAEPKRYWRQL